MSYVRVHFAKTQVQLRLDQHSSFPREYGINSPPCLLRRSERKGEEPKAQGDGEVCRRGGCKVHEANDNRICCLSNRAIGGCRLRHTYCKRGIVMYVRVHFAKAQVQLRLDQNSSFPRVGDLVAEMLEFA